MGVFSTFMRGVTKGRRSAVSERSVHHASELVEYFCQQLGWSIDERIDAREIRLHFKDPLIGIRKVVVTASTDDPAMSFTMRSSVGLMPARKVPADALAYLLERNSRLIVTWQMYLGSDGNALFGMSYYTYSLAMNPTFFKHICETMVQEDQAFDAKMKEIRAASLAHLLQYNGPRFGEKP